VRAAPVAPPVELTGDTAAAPDRGIAPLVVVGIVLPLPKETRNDLVVERETVAVVDPAVGHHGDTGIGGHGADLVVVAIKIGTIIGIEDGMEVEGDLRMDMEDIRLIDRRGSFILVVRLLQDLLVVSF